MSEDHISHILMSLPEGAAIDIFTDGAAEPSNPGPAGSAFVVVHGGVEIAHWSEHLGFTTNNIAEMTAALRALETVQDRLDLAITIVTDSQYVANGLTKWLPKWKANGWRTADRKPVKNRELWERLDELASRLPKLSWQWVRGHAGNRWNEVADQLANGATKAPAGETAA